MKKFILLFFLLPLLTVHPQRIGKLAPEKPHVKFPPHAWGIDLLFGEGGFGLGTFFRYNFTETLTGFADFSISESKDEREFERFDIFGRPLPIFGKKNRVFLLPLNIGIHKRLFYDDLTDNLRPYVSVGVGPVMIVTTPAEEEFFSSFERAQAKYGMGGYVGLGANFGLSTSNLLGITFRYSLAHLFNEGVENFYGTFLKDIGSFYFAINLGIMY